VLDIAAWNYPLLIAVNVVVPALLAGNGVLIKHSTKTPLCGGHFETAFGSAMPGLVQNLILTHDQTLAIFKGGLVDHAVFTGSVTGGREIYRAVAEHFNDVGLELGGKDAAYVAEDADLAFTVPNVVDGACYNAGQSCCAVERAYVHRSCHDAFIECAETVMSEYPPGRSTRRKLNHGASGIPRRAGSAGPPGGGCGCKGRPVDPGRQAHGGTDGNFYLPTLLVDVPNDAEVMQAESFGPILPVLAVESDQEAEERMNDSRFGLTASVWTGSQERAEWFARRLKVGTVYQNRCDYLDPALPWTGAGDSGKGRASRCTATIT
jgi:acyl-CoA reductase-like NAD-dependent aldehyde dehydrogenase